MESGLAEFVEYVALIIEGMAILIIAFASVQAFVRILRIAFGSASTLLRRQTYRDYLRWLVAALTFQLAADIVNTSIAPNWEEIGRVGAIAAIRTFLSYFVEKDVHEANEMIEAAREAEAASSRPTAAPVRAGSHARPESMVASHRE